LPRGEIDRRDRHREHARDKQRPPIPAYGQTTGKGLACLARERQRPGLDERTVGVRELLHVVLAATADV